MIQSLTELTSKSELDQAVAEALEEAGVERRESETYMDLAGRIEDAHPELAKQLRAASARRNVLSD